MPGHLRRKNKLTKGLTLQPLGSRDGLFRYSVESIEDLDATALASVMSQGWAADYTDHLRPDFDESYLHHALAGSSWVAVLVATEAGDPIGFELALERTLNIRHTGLKAYYATLFTVSSRYRRRGIGRWVLEGINQLAFEQNQADLIFSMFHRGAAGSPTVQATYDDISNWQVNRFHNTPIWGRRIDKDPLPTVPEPAAVARIVWPQDQCEWGLEAIKGEVTLPSSDTFRQTIRDGYDVGFDLDASFRSHYLGADGSDGGMFWYDLGKNATCCISYSLMPLAVNDRKLRPAGMVQTVHGENCTAAHYEQVLVHLANYLIGLGCFALSVYDLGVIPEQTLKTLGLEADEDRYDYTVRGPTGTIEQFSSVKPPYFVDFT